MENLESSTSNTQTEESSQDMPWNTKSLKEGPFQIDDGAFVVWRTVFDVWRSADSKGREMSTGGTREGVEKMTRWTLKCEQEGWPEGAKRVIGKAYNGVDL